MKAGYAAGIVYFGEDRVLSTCLNSLKRQSLSPRSIVVIDHNAEKSELGRELRREHPDVEWISQPNTGYAGGANAILSHSMQEKPAPSAVLILNADIQLAPEFAERLMHALEAQPSVALASGKLLRPGGTIIDSAGIETTRGRRFRARGSEEIDRGQYDQEERVFAVSGAALMLRTAVLPDLAVMGEIFDEDFFSYHEDTDLGWRARQMGYHSLYVPSARATHGRGWRREGRERVPLEIRRHSFKNRYLEMIKNEGASDFWRNLPSVLGMELARLTFVLARDRKVLPGYLDAVRGVPRAFRKRRLIQQKQIQQGVGFGAVSDGGKAERTSGGAIGRGRRAT